MLDLDNFDAGLSVGIGVVGAETAVTAIDAVTGAFERSVDAAANVELLKKSMASLASIELVDRGKFADIDAAASMAERYADAFYATQARMAAQSPFSLDEVSGLLKTASAYGFLATQIQDVARARELEVITAQRLAQVAMDTTAGTGQVGRVAGEMTEIIGRATATGRYLQEDMNMLIDRQINVVKILADAWGKPTAEIKKMQTAGELTANTVNATLIPALESMYQGKAAQAGETISGRLSTFQDALMFRSLDTFQPAIQTLSVGLDRLNESLLSEDSVQAAEALGAGLNTVAEAGVTIAPVFVETAQAVSGLFIPAVAGAGAAAATSAAQWLAAGGAANLLAAGLSNVASTAWAAQAAIRGMTVATVAPAAIAGTVAGLVSIQNELTASVDHASDALYENTRGHKEVQQALAAYEQLSPAAKAELEGLRDHLVAVDEANREALNTDMQAAARSGLFQSQAEATKIAADNANIRGQQAESLADALLEEAQASRNAEDAAIAHAVAEGKSAEALEARLQAVREAAQARDKLIANEREFQHALIDLEQERQQKERDARQTLYDAQRDAQEAYHTAVEEAEAAHQQRLHDIRTATYTSLLDSALDHAQSLLENEADKQDELDTLKDDAAQDERDAEAQLEQDLDDIRNRYDQKELDERERHQDELADLREQWNDKLRQSQEEARQDAQTALDKLADVDANFYRDSEQRLEEWNTRKELLHRQGTACQLEEERRAFEESEQQAARAYLDAEQAQREHLGQMLIDFTLSQALKNDVSAEALDEMLTGISRATGLYDSASAQLLGDTFSGIARWAETGGQGTATVLANMQALPDAAAQARIEQERLTDAMVEQAVTSYMATGNIDGYQQALQNIPGSVATQMGFSVSDYESNEILTAHQAHLDAIAAAKAEHNQTMNDLDDQRKQDADEARQDMRDSLTTEEELQQKRQEIRDKYADKAEDLKLDYAQQIGKTLFAKGLSQKEVTTFLQNEMPAALAEVERINANLKRNLESGMAPEAAAVQWAYAMDASQYADLTGKEGGKVGDSIETQIDDLKTATETKITAMQDAWDTYKTTLTQDIPQWYKDSKTKILTSHAQQVADLKAQLTDLTEAEQQALMDIAIAHGQFLARYDLDMQQSMRNLVRSGVEGDAFYRQYAQLTAQAGEVLDMSTRTREQQTADIVTGSRPTFAAPTLVIDTITLSVDGKTFTGFVEDISTRVLEEDYEDSVKNGAMRRR